MANRLTKLRHFVSHIVENQDYSVLAHLSGDERQHLQVALHALFTGGPQDLSEALARLPIEQIEMKVLSAPRRTRLQETVAEVASLFFRTEDRLERDLRRAYAGFGDFATARQRYEFLSRRSRNLKLVALEHAEEGHTEEALRFADRCPQVSARELIYAVVITQLLMQDQESGVLMHARRLLPASTAGLECLIAYRLGRGDLDGVRSIVEELGVGKAQDAAWLELAHAYVERGASISAAGSFRRIDSRLSALRALPELLQPFFASGQPMSAEPFIEHLGEGPIQERAALYLAEELFRNNAIDEAQLVVRRWVKQPELLRAYIKHSALQLLVERNDASGARRQVANLDKPDIDLVRLYLVKELTQRGRLVEARDWLKQIDSASSYAVGKRTIEENIPKS